MHIVLVLVVDSSTPAVTAAVAEVSDDGVALRAERQVLAVLAGGAGKAHGELLAPAVDAVLAEAGARPHDLGAIVAGVGPGPFTGLRVGLVTAASMGQALDVPTYGVCSLDAIGQVEGRVLVATDARRREVYWAGYEAGVRLTEPAVDLPAVVAERAAALGLAAAVGAGAHKYADVLGLPLRDEPRYPLAAALVALAGDRVRAKAPTERLTPLYLRRPDAVAQAARKPVLR